MDITYVGDSGARLDWVCEHLEKQYVVSYHHENDCWTVQLLRKDGEREVLAEEEAGHVLREFAKQEASNKVVWPASVDGDDRICDDSGSVGEHEPQDSKAHSMR